jgi:hypothetical protein
MKARPLCAAARGVAAGKKRPLLSAIPHEGDLSVILCADNIRLCRMSFCYPNDGIVGLTSHMTMLISRNQTDRVPSRYLLNRCFKQDMPQLFCLSVVCGVAIVNEFEAVLAIKHDA